MSTITRAIRNDDIKKIVQDLTARENLLSSRVTRPGGRDYQHQTTDTAALNSWGRRVYVFSDGEGVSMCVGVCVSECVSEWVV